MKKIPTLFERVYENHKIVDILPKVTEGMEWVLAGCGAPAHESDTEMTEVVQIGRRNET